MHRPFVVAAVGVLAVSSLDAAGAAIEASEGALGPGAWALVVAAPWALGLGGGLALTARGVARISSLLAPLVDAARTHAVAHRASLGALALSGALGLGLAVGAAALAGSALVSAVRTPLYAALAVLLAAAVCLLLGVGATAAAFPWVERGSLAVARRPRLASWLRPRLVAAATGGGLLAAGLTWLSRTSLVEGLPWARLAVATLVALALTWLAIASRRAGRVRAALDQAARPLLALTLLGSALALVPHGHGARAALARQRSLAAIQLRALDRVTDLDGDGAGSLYGGADCAPLDAKVGPHVAELADNGVDEDCSGHDARSDTLRLHLGSPRHLPARAASEPRPHVILVTTDALSFAHTGVGGYDRPVTPELDAWSARATVFERAFATSSCTANALPALLSGRLVTHTPALLPPQNQASPGGASAPTLPQLLRGAGYRSIALPGTRHLTVERWPALMSTFDEVDLEPLLAAEARGPRSKPYAAADLVQRALEHLDAAGDQPLLLWLHFFDHHPPYQLPPGVQPMGDGRSELDRYDSELRFADQHWGALFEGVEQRLAPSRYVLWFSADHGEAFDPAHPRDRHDHSLHTAETHVPLIVQTASQRGQRRSGLASHLDLVPTLLDLLDVPSREELRGESLAPALLGPSEPQKTVVSGVLWQPRGAPFGAPALRSTMLRTEEWLFIDDRERGVAGLFAPRHDPLGVDDRAREHPHIAEWARWALRQVVGPLPER